MNLLDCTTWIKKLALLATLTVVTSVGLLIDAPIEAQLNPRPSIFKEFPYNRNRASKRKVKRRSIHRSKKAKPKKPGTVASNRRRPFTQVQKKSPNEPFTIEFRAPGYPSSR